MRGNVIKNWNNLQKFLLAATYSGYSAAARNSKYDPAALQRAVSKLESEAQQKFFIAGRRGLRLTDSGRALHAFVDEISREMSNLWQEKKPAPPFMGNQNRDTVFFYPNIATKRRNANEKY